MKPVKHAFTGALIFLLAVITCWTAVEAAVPAREGARRPGLERPAERTGTRQADDEGGLLRLPESVLHESDIEYARDGARSLRLDMLRPASWPAESLPAIVFIHGGGWRNGDKARNLPRLVGFVESGRYVCFSIGYRLSGEAKWPAQLHDCKAAIRFLRANAERFHIDPERIGVMGSSAGGHLVSLLGTSQDPALEGALGVTGVSSRVRCVVAVSPPTDLADWGVEPAENAKRSIEQLFGAPWGKARETALEASPVSHVSADDPPFLIIHSREDAGVPFVQAGRLADKLEAAGVHVTLVPVEGALHGVALVGVAGERIGIFLARPLHGEKVSVSADPITPPSMR